MSKIKLFLLGGILSILTIGSFTSAYLEEVSCIEGYQQGISLPCYIPDDFDKFVCNGNFDVTLNGQFGGIYTLYCPFSFDKDTLLGMIGNNRYYSSADGLYLLIENGLPDPVIEGGTSQFTPVISGLLNSVKQFIPYVIYIGIGILIAVLGFFAIRWLVNWIVGKINSIFNSKRN